VVATIRRLFTGGTALLDQGDQVFEHGRGDQPVARLGEVVTST